MRGERLTGLKGAHPGLQTHGWRSMECALSPGRLTALAFPSVTQHLYCVPCVFKMHVNEKIPQTDFLRESEMFIF